MKKEELSGTELLILNSMEFNTICPHCGRAVQITPKDLIWQFEMTILNSDGSKKTFLPGWVYQCKCGKDIPVDIIMKINKDRIGK